MEGYDRFASKVCRVEFWPGKVAELDLVAIAASAIRVKSISSPFPLRSLELYLNTTTTSFPRQFGRNSIKSIKEKILPTSSGRALEIGNGIPQPPFAWRDADPLELGFSFTYNTNAFYRILTNLQQAGHVCESEIPALLDDACLLLGAVYRTDDYSLIKSINNNLNMCLVPKVVEQIVGKTRFNADCQELAAAQSAVDQAILLASRRLHLPLLAKMKISLGMGVSFIESRLQAGKLTREDMNDVEACAHRFDDSTLAIDHRAKLLEMISCTGSHKGMFDLAVILDDAAESIDDFLWLQDAVRMYPFLRTHLLINSRQISVNFSSHLLKQVWQAPIFRGLASRLGSQVSLTLIDSPLVSLQTNYLPKPARQVIDGADAIYIKGANFFETCQLQDKDTFYAFVVYGAMSRRYSGLSDFDGVFAYVPRGRVGYVHHVGSAPVTLRDLVAPSTARYGSN